MRLIPILLIAVLFTVIYPTNFVFAQSYDENSGGDENSAGDENSGGDDNSEGDKNN